MYEVDFTGWTRTPEDLDELRTHSWKRRRFHLRRFYYSIIRRRWLLAWYNLQNIFTNTKVI